MRHFNTTGTCFQEEHYMVDISGKLAQIREMIDRGAYFTINRARQYGKTTTLWQLEQEIQTSYNVLSISFEGMGNAFFQSESEFVQGFLESIRNAIKYSKFYESMLPVWENNMDTIKSFNRLSEHITEFCLASQNPVVLIVDEVDKSSDNQLFMDFLGMLRNKYLLRKKTVTFHSVILAGVYDIKNLKLKIAVGDERKYNSPWNVAADFLVDMSFNSREIETMLEDYEAEHNTKMDIPGIAELIYSYTDGYPFLVSKICEKIDTEDKYQWNSEGIRACVKELLTQTNTLFDDLIKNLENDRQYREFVKAVLFATEPIPFRMSNPLIARGVMFGVFKETDGCVSISNRIFEMYIYEYFISAEKPLQDNIGNFEYIKNGELDMQTILLEFQKTMKRMEGNVESFEKFVESQGRLLLVAFLTPILNVTGHYVIESFAKDKTRMDVQIFYGSKEYVLELKIWHGAKREEQAYRQLSGYMDSRSLTKGYLINFVFNKTKEYRAEWIKYNGGEIFEITV